MSPRPGPQGRSPFSGQTSFLGGALGTHSINGRASCQPTPDARGLAPSRCQGHALQSAREIPTSGSRSQASCPQAAGPSAVLLMRVLHHDPWSPLLSLLSRTCVAPSSRQKSRHGPSGWAGRMLLWVCPLGQEPQSREAQRPERPQGLWLLQSRSWWARGQAESGPLAPQMGVPVPPEAEGQG